MVRPGPAPRRRAAARCAALAVAIAVAALATLGPRALAAAVTGPSAAPAQATGPALVLQAGSTTTIAPGGAVIARLRLTGVASAAGLELAATLHQRLATRQDVATTANDERLRGSVLAAAPIPLASVPVDTDGAYVLQVPTTTASRTRPLPAGVYPLELEVRGVDDGDSVARLIAHVVALGTDAPKTSVVLALPVGTPPGTPAGAAIGELARSLERHAGAPITLAPTPQTLEAMAEGLRAAEGTKASAGGPDAVGLAALHGKITVQRTYVPVQAGTPVGAGPGSFDAQLLLGRSIATTLLGTAPDTTTWLADDGLGATQLDRLSQDGLRTVVARTAVVAPATPSTTTTARPGRRTTTTVAPTPVAATTGAHPLADRPGVTVLVADPVLSGLLADSSDGQRGPLLANRFVAEVAAAAGLGAPAPNGTGATPMTLVAYGDRRSTPSATFLDPLLDALGTGQIASLVAPGDAKPDATTVRTTLTPSDVTEREAITRAARAVAAHEGVFGPGLTADEAAGRPEPAGSLVGSSGATSTSSSEPATTTSAAPATTAPPTGAGTVDPFDRALRRDLLMAASNDLDTGAQNTRLADVATRADGQLHQLQVPTARSIALTARTGQVPIALLNNSGRRAHVLLHLSSEKLTFPAGSDRLLDLDRRTNVTDVSVRVRASGTLPLTLQLLTPDAKIELARTDGLSIRSNSIPPVGVGLGASALVVLLVWWVRSVLRERRTGVKVAA